VTEGRLDQFKADIADMRIKDPAIGKDALLLRAGAVGLVAGIAVTIVAFFLSHNTSSALTQGDDHIVALIGVAVTVASAAVFVRYSITGFLRFWLARLIYEQQIQGDRLAAREADRETSKA
jgi:hypothetical protein